MLTHLARSEREHHRWQMHLLTEKIRELRGDRTAASILAKINATSLQRDEGGEPSEEPLSKDWLDSLFRGRKSVDPWELRALARGLAGVVADQKEERRRRAEIFGSLAAIAFPLEWSGADAI